MPLIENLGSFICLRWIGSDQPPQFRACVIKKCALATLTIVGAFQQYAVAVGIGAAKDFFALPMMSEQNRTSFFS
jgi:hypothetical protein